ncbi:MAG: hypothetical protein KKF48_00350 [Nanoarchaeota archaeon]|nr:hypothetical protein [Nanoarchaeota archaeon]MBU1027475.1 hypothetical protein [Nanoarchaeota archaeon]
MGKKTTKKKKGVKKKPLKRISRKKTLKKKSKIKEKPKKKTNKKKSSQVTKKKQTRPSRIQSILSKHIQSKEKPIQTIEKPTLLPERILQRPKTRFIRNIVKNSKGVLRRTNIISKLPKIGTGISGFDQISEGGFEKESINLVIGGSGSGKTIFALRFLLEGVKRGETVLYVSFEEKKKEFYNNMGKLGWDLQRLENSGKFIFLEYSPEKVKMTLDEGGGTIETLILRHKITRMVMDSITSFSLLFEDALSKKQANLGLFDIINKWNTTTLLTVQHDPLKGKSEDVSTIEFEADSITLLYFTKVRGERKRFIEILKMRGTNHSKDTYMFEIGRGGIVIGRQINLKKFI